MPEVISQWSYTRDTLVPVSECFMWVDVTLCNPSHPVHPVSVLLYHAMPVYDPVPPGAGRSSPLLLPII